MGNFQEGQNNFQRPTQNSFKIIRAKISFKKVKLILKTILTHLLTIQDRGIIQSSAIEIKIH